jgi:hypothetical protein
MGGFVALATSQMDQGIFAIALVIVLGGAIYLLALRVQRSDELDLVTDLVRRRFIRSS